MGVTVDEILAQHKKVFQEGLGMDTVQKFMWTHQLGQNSANPIQFPMVIIIKLHYPVLPVISLPLERFVAFASQCINGLQ